MYYESSDFLETADSDTLKQIARTRELTREYYFSDYGDTEKRTSILRELLGGIGENSVIGAGSVVTRPIPPNCVAVGNPCRVKRAISERDKEYYFRDLKIDLPYTLRENDE